MKNALRLYLFFEIHILKNYFSKFSIFVCQSLEKVINEKHFPVKEKFGLVFRKVLFWKIWTENIF